MIDLYELKQFVSFAEHGTLSAVAEEFHISTPSVTRSMQHLEDVLGVMLFTRSKNHIALNETGRFAVACARKLLQESEHTVSQIRTFDARQRTIVIRSCAPAPLWELLHKLSKSCPQMTISSTIVNNADVLKAWKDGSCDMAILPFPEDSAIPFMTEHLFVCVLPDHPLAAYQALSLAQLNGFNFLLRSELGFWDELCREKMPASKFLVQANDDDFVELVRASTLPCFTTDYILKRETPYPDRVYIPVTDPEVNVTFYLLSRKSF